MRDVLPIEDFRLIMVEYNKQTSNTWSINVYNQHFKRHFLIFYFAG
jgi:hypothetical protein